MSDEPKPTRPATEPDGPMAPAAPAQRLTHATGGGRLPSGRPTSNVPVAERVGAVLDAAVLAARATTDVARIAALREASQVAAGVVEELEHVMRLRGAR